MWWICEHVFRIQIRGTVIMNNYSGSGQLITDPPISRSIQDIFVAIEKNVTKQIVNH
jgi:hypothetical protein